MNILYILSGAYRGGVEHLALRLGQVFAETDHAEVVFVDCGGPLLKSYERTFAKCHGVFPYYLRLKEKGAPGGDFTRLTELIEDYLDRADVVHLFNHFAVSKVLGNSLYAAKFVQSVHFHPDAMRPEWKETLAAIEQKIRAVIVDSRLHASYLSNPTYIPNFVDTGYWRPDNREREGVLWVGKFTRAKGPELLLEIATRLGGSLCVVDGVSTLPGANVYHTQLRAMGVRVLASRSQEQMRELYRSHARLLITSKHEGMPISLLEGMSCGICPISTSVGAIPDVIQHKQNGYFYETAKEAIEYIKAENLGRAARRTTCAKFCLNRAIQQFRAAYSE